MRIDRKYRNILPYKSINPTFPCPVSGAMDDKVRNPWGFNFANIGKIASYKVGISKGEECCVNIALVIA